MPRNQARRPGLVEQLDAGQLRVLVARLLDGQPRLRREAEAHAEELLSQVTAEEIAVEVASAVEYCDVDLLYANSGKTRYGYEDPHEVAAEMLAAALEPTLALMRERLGLGREAEAARICQGVLLGLYAHRHGCGTTDKVLGFDPDFPARAAEDALRCYLRGAKRSRQPEAFPAAFWALVEEWSDLATLA